MTPELRIEVQMNIAEFKLADSSLHALLQGAAYKDLARRAVAVESLAKRIATGPPGSAPGEGPGVVTGRLRASITWRLGTDHESPYADIGSAVFYAPFLELGTRKMEPRPFLKPALAAART